MLGAFNLTPAFPLDDGRILRAVLVKRNRNYDAATRIVVRTKWWLGLSNDHSSAAREKIIERIKSMVFLCMYCNYPNPISISMIDFEYHASGPYATAFFICPDCKNKFLVKIQDQGKVRKK